MIAWAALLVQCEPSTAARSVHGGFRPWSSVRCTLRTQASCLPDLAVGTFPFAIRAAISPAIQLWMSGSDATSSASRATTAPRGGSRIPASSAALSRALLRSTALSSRFSRAALTIFSSASRQLFAP